MEGTTTHVVEEGRTKDLLVAHEFQMPPDITVYLHFTIILTHLEFVKYHEQSPNYHKKSATDCGEQDRLQ
jgi:hypothetical protein